MKSRLIGEILTEFKIDDVAYCFKGKNEGAVIVCDDEGRLITTYSDGYSTNSFYFRVLDIPEEEGREWMLLREIEDEDLHKEMNIKVAITIAKAMIREMEEKEKTE